ncbi:hypothetical protein N0V82_006756 [Gnomoniopsis sp. IMI 355080]|nr:hypothetical protein N0V82_006756 [Gnomoniopsis sp. IMI 355080]
MATNGNGIHQEQYSSASATPADTPSTTDPSATASHSKDEVGWYFVQQYYTTLSKNTSKLHLFYNKQSQFVQGPEAELVDVSVGRQDIQEAIKQLDFQDCKVRVSNVDSQASFNNIVIQVIGEISNKGGEPKKFVQTFVLAQQPAGYFLLNDIMRYINEGEEETVEGANEENAAAPTAEPEAPQELAAEAEAEKTETEEVSDAALDTQAVDKKLEETASGAKEAPSTSAVEPAAEPVPVAQEATPSKPEVADPSPEPEKIVQEIAEEETKKPDVPKEPSPTPAPAPARAPAAEPEKPKEPPKPMSWASRVAAAAGSAAPKPVVPLPAKTTSAPAQPAQSRPAAAPAAAQTTAPSQPANKENTKETKETKEESEWRMADSKRQSRQHSVAPTPEKDGTLAYVKFVTDKVKDDELRAALSSHGELVYFDINRSKNCAFVEYGSTSACQSAIKASPITIAGDNIVIEPRRPKAGAYGGANYNQNRGSISGRGRGGFEGNRSGSQGGGRGGFANRGRGGAPRGRGGVQTTNA